ncbi:unnamed protein product [Gordionus sp. m RMFG-2023]
MNPAKDSNSYLKADYEERLSSTKHNLEGIIIGIDNNRYRIAKHIGSGTFGELRYCRNIITNETLAVKIEPNDAEIPQLKREYDLYCRLHGDNEGYAEGFPRVYYFGTCQEYKVMVMDLLGPSLQDLFQYCNKKFTLKTVLMLAIQLITRIEYIHYYGLVYRDIKPENFLIGKRSNGTEGIIWVVDFGLAKEYIDKNGKHIKFREQKPLTGTARYMSVNTHFGLEQSRRDDLEGLAYMFLYFLKGSLPWQGLKLIKTDSSKQKYRKIAEMKRDTSPDELCHGWPDEFKIFLRYARGLDFVETPDYAYLRRLLEELIYFYGWEYDFNFDWSGKLPSSPEGSVSMTYAQQGSKPHDAKYMQRMINLPPSITPQNSTPNENISFDLVWPERDIKYLLPPTGHREAMIDDRGVRFDLIRKDENYRDYFEKRKMRENTSTKIVYLDAADVGGEDRIPTSATTSYEGPIGNPRVKFAKTPDVRDKISVQKEPPKKLCGKICKCFGC